MRALDYWHTAESLEHTGRLRQIMLHRDGMAPSARDLHASWGRDLQLAETYYVAPDICDAIVQASWSLPSDTTLRPNMSPSHKGFVYLSKPIRVRWPGDNGGVDWCAFTWGPYEQYPPGYEPDGEGPDPSRMIREGQDITTYERRGSWIMPFGALGWPYGDPVDGWKPIAAGDGIAAAPSNDLTRRFILAFFAFISQRIIVAPSQRAERSTRKRAGRVWVEEPLIRVVQLRRPASTTHHDGDAQPVEWSCRWVVSGHWRQQWYPSTGDHRPVWVLPYVKGPESAPLKPPRAKVFAVVR